MLTSVQHLELQESVLADINRWQLRQLAVLGEATEVFHMLSIRKDTLDFRVVPLSTIGSKCSLQLGLRISATNNTGIFLQHDRWLFVITVGGTTITRIPISPPGLASGSSWSTEISAISDGPFPSPLSVACAIEFLCETDAETAERASLLSRTGSGAGVPSLSDLLASASSVRPISQTEFELDVLDFFKSSPGSFVDVTKSEPIRM
jgi:hypothetical protein